MIYLIFKKPYKFLLKHFKLIHLILTILTIYIANKTNAILKFFNEYDGLSNYISTANLTDNLFNIYVFILPIFVVIGLIIIVYLLSLKDKPRKFYFYNIFIFIFSIIANLYTYRICNTLEVKVVDIRIIKAIENIYLMLYVIEIIDIIFIASRALGFNIRKFNFDGDDLDISEKDNEEFELKLEFDTNKTKRNIKRNIRYIWYSYRENMLYTNIFIIIFFIGIGIFIYVDKNYFNKIYNEGDYILIDNISFNVSNTFITNVDNDDNKITNNNLIIIRLNIKKTDTLKEKLVLSKIILESDDLDFKNTQLYNDKLSDIGTIYSNQILSNTEYNEYLLIYEIPLGFENNLVLKYNYGNKKNKKIKLNPKQFNKNNFDVEINLNEELTIDNDVIKNTILTISSYGINDTFKLDYKYKAYDNKYYDSYEYITSDYIDNCDKTIIKLSGDIKNNKLSFPKFIEKYGKIEYVKNSETNIINTKIRNIKPTKTTSNNYYFSVCNEFKDADNINLIFKIRGNIYRFILK